MSSVEELQKVLKQYVESLKQARSSRRSREYAVEVLYQGLKEFVRSQPDDRRFNELMDGYLKDALSLNSEDRIMRYQLKKAFRELSKDRSRGDPSYQLRIAQFQEDSKSQRVPMLGLPLPS